MIATTQFRCLPVSFLNTLEFYLYFVWLWNLVLHTKGGTQIDGVWEEGGEKNIWI
jgi:hypothetical protein